jgi:hypothetical protein
MIGQVAAETVSSIGKRTVGDVAPLGERRESDMGVKSYVDGIRRLSGTDRDLDIVDR